MSFLSYAVALLMTAVAVSRAPAMVHGDPHRRALFGCYAGFAGALWLKTPVAQATLNDSRITDLSVLLKHYAAALAVLAILSYIATIFGGDGSEEKPEHPFDSWLHRGGAAKTALAAMVLMTALFFTVVDRSRPSVEFVPEHVGQLGATAYMSVFYLYLGSATALCGYRWGAALRCAKSTLMRLALGLMTIAMAMGVLYAVIRISFMWLAVCLSPPSGSFSHSLAMWTDVLQMALFVLFAAGACLPSSQVGYERLRTARSLWGLHPLWRDLRRAFPEMEQPFFPTVGRLRALARVSVPLDVRLDRVVQDIADALEQLRHFAPPDLLTAAGEAAEGQEAEQAATEAYWVRAAMAAKSCGLHWEVASAALPSKPINNSVSEASWLGLVEQHYRSVTVEQAHRVVARAVELEAVQ
ncbi:MAB_1171c family putative transporter [Kitasatospora sp. NPDC088783]|uniref:MAB_1171c family putative transporter n=1 Tax=Kitasatospora sp. NPDC088783 TaxID=3364077 RepID=UPI00380C45FF